ncbi:MAG: hypothetical protein WBA07_14120 [Rivularia sp. (in: cyanobacteria)]
MIPVKCQTPLFILSGLTAAIAGVISFVGILNNQIYLPFTPEELLPGVMSQDIISLLASLGLLVCLVAIRRGANRAWTIWLGLTGYFFYAYALYAFGAIYNRFFLCYIAIVGLTIYAAIIFFANVNLDFFQRVEERQIPRKIISIYLFFLSALFYIIWLSQIFSTIRSGVSSGINTVWVLDLAFVLPLLVIGAVLLFRKKPLGDLLAPVILIKAGTLGFSVFLGELLKPYFGQVLDPFMIGLFAVLGLGSLSFAGLTFSRFGQLHTQNIVSH